MLIKSNCRSSEKLWRRPLRLDKIKCKHTVKGDLLHHRHNQRFSYQACIKFSRLCSTLAYSRHQHQQRVRIQRRNISGLKKKRKKFTWTCLIKQFIKTWLINKLILTCFIKQPPGKWTNFTAPVRLQGRDHLIRWLSLSPSQVLWPFVVSLELDFEIFILRSSLWHQLFLHYCSGLSNFANFGSFTKIPFHNDFGIWKFLCTYICTTLLPGI